MAPTETLLFLQVAAGLTQNFETKGAGQWPTCPVVSAFSNTPSMQQQIPPTLSEPLLCLCRAVPTADCILPSSTGHRRACQRSSSAARPVSKTLARTRYLSILLNCSLKTLCNRGVSSDGGTPLLELCGYTSNSIQFSSTLSLLSNRPTAFPEAGLSPFKTRSFLPFLFMPLLGQSFTWSEELRAEKLWVSSHPVVNGEGTFQLSTKLCASDCLHPWTA